MRRTDMRTVTRAPWIVGLLAAAGLLAPGPASAQGAGAGRAPGVVKCAKCHTDRRFLAANATEAGQDTALFVPPDILHGTVHDTLACTDCHVGYGEGFPHNVSRTVVPCATCHEQQGKDYEASIHAENAATRGDAPTCVDCHGSHTVLGPDDPESVTYPLNVAGLCGRCHGDPEIIGRYFTGEGFEQARIATEAFPKSVHGIGLSRDGLVVSATCSDCHRAHLILPADSPRSSVSRRNIPQTCGSCHAGVLQVFETSAHGPDYPEQPGVAEGHEKPVCVDCHTAHEIVRPDRPAWQQGAIQTCGSCHEDLYETYFETYHGQVTRLGSTLAAKCSDCHTAHDMRPASDAKSTVFAGNLVETCGQCHEGANANFVKYYAHGDPTQRTRYPRLYWPWLFMTVLLVGVMSFFVLHSVLWLIRNAIEHSRAGSGGGDLPPGRRPPPRGTTDTDSGADS